MQEVLSWALTPEVRKFYQLFHRFWPYGLYFCDLRTDTLTMDRTGFERTARTTRQRRVQPAGPPRLHS